MSTGTVETVVIGAGVIGLAVARALALSGREVIVLETHPGIGMETSSRSSEVIHAGLYYEPGSLKARCCVRGKEVLYRYCADKGIPHRRIGKLIVANGETQAAALQALNENATASGVRDLELIDPHRLALMEPEVRADAALWSPSTGIMDSHALMLALQADLEGTGGTVVLNSTVIGGRVVDGGCDLVVDSGETTTLKATLAINAAGLYATHVAGLIEGLPPESVPEQFLISGHYFTCQGPSKLNHLVYPVPDPIGLGIHATLDMAGQLRFGPDATHCDSVDYRFDESKKHAFAESVRRWFPALDEDRLQPGYVGIRPKLSGPDRGDLDFVISGPEQHGVPGLINLYGIESPGLTSCLALAEEVFGAADIS